MTRPGSRLQNRSLAVLCLMLLSALIGAGVVLAQAPARPAQTPPPAPLGTGFTYQGELSRNGFAVTDNSCALTFSLWSLPSGGLALGADQLVNPVTVTNGLFTVFLNGAGQFGPDAFNGDGRWLQTAVQCAGDGVPVTLTRQALTAAPYALYAVNAAAAVTATLAQTATFAQAVNPLALPGTRPYYPLMRPMTLDLSVVDSGLKNFLGGFTDGRYGYFVPDVQAQLGKVARVDLQNFSPTGITFLDMSALDGGVKGFSGGFSDGRYGYLVPYVDSSVAASGKLARIDLNNFTAGGVVTMDLALVDSGLKGFFGGFTDGRYGYFVPASNSAKIARVDLDNFTAGGVVTLDLALVNNNLRLFTGGFTDGRYAYFVPDFNGAGGKLVRVDLQNFTTGGVTVLDLALVDPGLKGFQGGFTDGRYGYLVPNGIFVPESGKVARIDLNNFSASGVVTLDLTLVDGGLRGFEGGFTDGRYGYFVPFNNGAYDGKLARIDLQNFTPGGVAWEDLSATDPGLKGFSSGFTDGRFAYLAPQFNGVYDGRLARIPLFASTGAP